MKIVKRYSNRKFYLAGSGDYITYDDIEKMLVNGEEVRVMDAPNWERKPIPQENDITDYAIDYIFKKRFNARRLRVKIS